MGSIHPSATPTPAPRRFLAIGELMFLTAGLGVGLWVFRLAEGELYPNESDSWFRMSTMALGGLSAVGPILLVWDARRRRSRWGAGRLLWFSQGAAAWLLWPPVIRQGLIPRSGSRLEQSEALCYYYGTPLMAIYMLLALTSGGWVRGRRRRRTLPMDWRESFGWILAALWACTGLYLLSRIYWTEFRR